MRQTTVLLLLLAAVCGCRSTPPPPVSGAVHPLSATDAALSAAPAHPSAAYPRTIDPRTPHASAAGPQPVSTAGSAPAAQTSTASDQPGVNVGLLRQGYQPAQRNGVTVYCRKGALTGSRFASQICLTEAQIQQLERQAKEDMELSRTQSCNQAAGGCTGK